MENKNIIQYAIILALIIIGAIGVINLIKGSNNLRESKKIIENVLKEVSESRKLIENQTATIEELNKINKELSIKVNHVDSLNRLIKNNLNVNFSNANKTINDLKKVIDNIKPEVIH